MFHYSSWCVCACLPLLPWLMCLQVGILQKMQPCRNVVRLRGCFESNEEVMVVTDMCKGGDLQKLSDVSRIEAAATASGCM